MIGFSKCPHCGYETYRNGFCMSCGLGMAETPILEKDAADKEETLEKWILRLAKESEAIAKKYGVLHGNGKKKTKTTKKKGSS